MAKKGKISLEVIEFIIKERNNRKKVITFQQIADNIKINFDINVTAQAVRYQYEKNNGKISISTSKKETSNFKNKDLMSDNLIKKSSSDVVPKDDSKSKKHQNSLAKDRDYTEVFKEEEIDVTNFYE